MRICCIADMHGHLPEIPPCDLLLLGGDLGPKRSRDVAAARFWLDTTFRAWLEAVPAKAIVGVAGNHDFVFEKGHPKFDRPLPWTYLQDSATTVDGRSIWGTPWQPTFFNWAFNLDEPDLAAKWALVPEATDVLLLHGPPLGYGDPTPRGPAGSKSLLRRIEALQPRLAVAGHIHSGYGVYMIGATTFVNAAHVDESYQPANRPVLLDLTETGVETVAVGPL